MFFEFQLNCDTRSLQAIFVAVFFHNFATAGCSYSKLLAVDSPSILSQPYTAQCNVWPRYHTWGVRQHHYFSLRENVWQCLAMLSMMTSKGSLKLAEYLTM
jgi:hypothetical protein